MSNSPPQSKQTKISRTFLIFALLESGSTILSQLHSWLLHRYLYTFNFSLNVRINSLRRPLTTEAPHLGQFFSITKKI
jgi:hypothetical protein